MYRYGVAALAAVVLVFASGTFAHFVFPGPARPIVQFTASPTPYVSPCDRIRENMIAGRAPMPGYSVSQSRAVLVGLGCTDMPQTECPDCNCGD